MLDERILAYLDNPGDADREGLPRHPDGRFSIQEATDEPIDLGCWSHAAID